MGGGDGIEFQRTNVPSSSHVEESEHQSAVALKVSVFLCVCVTVWACAAEQCLK